MRPRIDSGKGVGDHTCFVDEIGDAAGAAGVPRTIGAAQHALGVAEQGELKAGFVGKRFIGLYAIKTRADNLHVVADKGVVVVTEPVPFPSSTAGAGLGVKPQHDFFAAQLRQRHRGAIVRRDGKIRRLRPNFKHHRSPQPGTHARPNPLHPPLVAFSLQAI